MRTTNCEIAASVPGLTEPLAQDNPDRGKVKRDGSSYRTRDMRITAVRVLAPRLAACATEGTWRDANGVDCVFPLARNARPAEHIDSDLAMAKREASRRETRIPWHCRVNWSMMHCVPAVQPTKVRYSTLPRGQAWSGLPGRSSTQR